MRAASLRNYPAIEQFVFERKLDVPTGTPLCEAVSNDLKILWFIEYWLSKRKNIKGSEILTEDFAKVCMKPHKDSVSNDFKEWYRIGCELETFYLLSYKLGMDVIGYEQAPANTSRRPDFEIRHGNERIYFEVKFKASQVVQRIPPKFDKFLDEIEERSGNKYRITLLEILNLNSNDTRTKPNYQKLFSKYLIEPANLNIIEKEIGGYIKVLEREDRQPYGRIISVNSGSETVRLHFSINPKQASSSKRPSGFMPDDIGDIRNWLFSEEDDKKPMITEAFEKAAHYLVVFIPFWQNNSNETFYNYITPLFSDLEIIRPNVAVSKDRNMGQMSGIILLSQKGSLENDYVVVNNASEGALAGKSI